MTTKTSVVMPAWPNAKQFRHSLRWQFPLMVTVLIVLLMAVTGYMITRQYVAAVTSHVIDRLMIQARSYAGPASNNILSPTGPDALLLNTICRELAAANPDLYWAGIADDRGLFLAHTDVRHLTAGDRLQLPAMPSDSIQHRNQSQTYIIRDTLYVYVPVTARNITVGHIAVAFPTTEITKARNQSIMTVGSMTLFAILAGMPLILFLVRRRLRPISTIITHLQKVDPATLSLEIPIAGRNEFAYLARTLQVMGSYLKTAQEERVQSERMVRELEIARDIQTSILPRKYPGGPNFAFHGTYFSANEVGGDYYDFLPFDNEQLGFLIADVSGKSLPGMLVMLMTRDIIRSLAAGDRDPKSLLCAVNRELIATIRKGMFVTMLYGLLDRRTGEVTLASAGHNPAIWIASATGTASQIHPPGYPLGLMESKVFDQRIQNERIRLAENDWLVIYTDGVNEARSPQGIEYGMDRLTNTLLTKRQLSAAALIEQTLQEHTAFVASAPQHDDITLVAMKWLQPTGHPVNEENVQHASRC